MTTSATIRFFHNGNRFNTANSYAGLQRLKSAFWQYSSDIVFFDGDLRLVIQCQDQEVILIRNLADLANQAARGQHFIPLAQGGHQVLVLLGTLGLWAKDHEIEDDAEYGQHDDHFLATASRCRCHALGISLGDNIHYVSS